MQEENIRKKVVGFLNEKPLLKNIPHSADFFDLGASSLTIVDIQIQLENELGITVPTSKLMSSPTVDDWVKIYQGLCEEVDA